MPFSFKITVGARSSPLSRAQVKEVLNEVSKFYPELQFSCLFVETTGDLDQITSLRTLGKTNFFTKEVDEMQLSGTCRISIHSAKDLPEKLPKGLFIAHLTKGLDPADVIVFRPGETLMTLPSNAVIATSSARREEAVRKLRKDLSFIDLRGTINQRLAKLDQGEADGIVVAEAALIRLELTHLNRLLIPGKTTPLQGQLAVVVRQEDQEMIKLFASL